MKSSPNVECIGPEAIFTVSKCTEIFIQYMSEEGLVRCNSKKILDYKGIADFVNTDPKLNFLAEILPRKMTFRDAKKKGNNYLGSSEPHHMTSKNALLSIYLA
ncbi:hypothetical protein GE061_003337 [Apolygus lucorum]|uniref:Transcription factor CBF/NF-Y/archaeal histone domain-containing protein n=1 Tax=Apolygus lucorum TaxID=248454 RepID=A0A6A4J400_APOLU|nr:hypothetical protein GE061_003337 [Apolygus lucorum]